jgi:hypothetical protein
MKNKSFKSNKCSILHVGEFSFQHSSGSIRSSGPLQIQQTGGKDASQQSKGNIRARIQCGLRNSKLDKLI